MRAFLSGAHDTLDQVDTLRGHGFTRFTPNGTWSDRWVVVAVHRACLFSIFLLLLFFVERTPDTIDKSGFLGHLLGTTRRLRLASGNVDRQDGWIN